MNRNDLIRLVTQAQKGKQDAMNDLFSEFYNDVYYFALKTVKDSDIACDITQETFLEIIRTIDKLKEPAAFVTWMKQITYHQCTRHFSKKTDVLVEEDEDGNTLFDTLADESEGSVPAEVLEQEEFRRTILDMIDQLTEEQRSAVLLYYFDELSVGQIAQIQDVSEGTVKSRLNYARKAMRKSVEAYEEKTGTKLHSIALLPLFMLFFGKEKMPAAKVALVRSAVAASAKTVAPVTLAAKLAQLPLVTKMVSGVVAGALLVSAAVVIANPKAPAKDVPQDEPTSAESIGAEIDNPEAPSAGTYESDLLTIFNHSDLYSDVFVEFEGTNLHYVRTTDGALAQVNGSEGITPVSNEKFPQAQHWDTIGAYLAFTDAQGNRYVVINDEALLLPQTNSPIPRILSTVHNEVRHYQAYYIDNNQLCRTCLTCDEHHMPMAIIDTTNMTCVYECQEFAVVNELRIIANDTVYVTTTNNVSPSSVSAIPGYGYHSKEVFCSTDDLLTDLNSAQLIYKDSAQNVIYIHDQAVAMPQGKTVDQITRAVCNEIALIVFDDGSIYLYGMDSDQTGLQLNQELTDLYQAGDVRNIFDAYSHSGMILLTLKNNVTYAINAN